jgi:hypothetical protein
MQDIRDASVSDTLIVEQQLDILRTEKERLEQEQAKKE